MAWMNDSFDPDRVIRPSTCASTSVSMSMRRVRMLCQVAGCIGISGKLCCDPGGTVVNEDTFKYGHVVWTDLVVEVQSSVDQELKENVRD